MAGTARCRFQNLAIALSKPGQMTSENTAAHRKYAVRYPSGLTAEEAIALLAQTCADIAPHLTLRDKGDGATIEGEPWHVLSVCLALPLFEMNEVG